MSIVKWIKIAVNIFDDEKILLIESMPENDTMLIIWFKLLSLAGKINNGGVLLLNNKVAYTDEMLATIFRKDIAQVKLALKTFEDLEMIVKVNNTITIANWSKHQSLDQLEKKAKYQREYMREYRKEQADLANGKKVSDKKTKLKASPKKNTKSKTTCKTNSKTKGESNVSSLEGERELELEEERDKDIYKNIVEYLNISTGKCYKYTSKTTRALIDARVNEGFNIEDFKKVIDTKVKSWKGDSKMSAFLRPNTLFGNKFESYLNEMIKTDTPEEYGW